MNPTTAHSHRHLLPTLFAAALALAACGKTPPQAPAPADVQAPTPAAAATTAESAGSNDASVPSADSVLKPGTAVKAEPDAGRANRAMSKTQESGSMPLPGQNNDHSAPLLPAKGASAP